MQEQGTIVVKYLRMKIIRSIFKHLGLSDYSNFTKASFVRHNVRALRTTCIVAAVSAVFFFLLSFQNPGYASPPVRIISLITVIFSITVFLFLQHFNQNNSSFHSFHFLILITSVWLSIFGIIISIHDCMAGGGFMVFLITQMWIFDMLLIPPFVSIILSGIVFTVFLSLINYFFIYPLIQFFEVIFFYITLIIINYFHYYTALQQTFEEENVIQDNAYLENISVTDSLTDVRNRAGLEADLNHYNSTDLYVMMMDIDNFKKYNDTYGHPTGDLILRAYAEGLLQTFGFHNVYRYGGDEFLVIKVMNSPEEFDDYLFRTKWIISHNHHDIPEGITCSCGYVYGTCNSDEDLQKMIRQADTYLYQAKAKGKNQVASGLFHNEA